MKGLPIKPELNCRKIIHAAVISTLVLGMAAPLLMPDKAYAGNLTNTILRLDRMNASTATGGTVCAKAVTVGLETDVQVTFPAGFTVNTTAANWTVTTTNLPLGSTAWVGILTATAVAGQVVTFPSGDLVVGTLYCFNFTGTSTLTTSTAASDKTGTIQTRIGGGTPTNHDIGYYATAVVTDGGTPDGDQISVTATVPATFSFSLSANTAALGNLSTTTTSAGGITTTVSTNAENGWNAWVKSTNANSTAGLYSPTAVSTLASAGTVDAAPSDLAALTGIVLDVDTGTNTPTVDAEYNGTNATSGGTLDTAFQPIASQTAPAAASTVTLIARAKIAATQPAATDYATTLTVVGAGNF